MSAHQQDLAAGQQDCTSLAARRAHRARRCVGIAVWTVDQGRGEIVAVVAAGNEDLAIGQQGCGSAWPAAARHRRDLAELPTIRIVDLGSLRIDTVVRIVPADDEHAAIGEQHRVGFLACRAHRSGRAEHATQRRIDLGAGESADAGVAVDATTIAAVESTADEYAAVGKQCRCCPLPARAEHAGLRGLLADRVEKLRSAQGRFAADIFATASDEHLARRQGDCYRCRTGFVQGQEWPAIECSTRRIVDFNRARRGRHGQATSDQHASIGHHRCGRAVSGMGKIAGRRNAQCTCHGGQGDRQNQRADDGDMQIDAHDFSLGNPARTPVQRRSTVRRAVIGKCAQSKPSAKMRSPEQTAGTLARFHMPVDPSWTM